MTYNPKNAVEYAKKWWNSRNPEFYNFDDLGGDCTNFVCQCLLAGGYKMKIDVNNGWFYKSLNYRSPSFSGVNELYNFGVNNTFDKGVKFLKISLTDVQIGDVIQLRQNPNIFNHSLLVTNVNMFETITQKDIFVSTHTIDAFNRPLSEYNFYEYRVLRPI